MKNFQREFLEFAIEVEALRFGQFTLKSGRISPYFFNAGRFNSGGKLARLGRFYARAIQDAGIHFTMLFGPAYKGIPLATATAVAFAEHFQLDVPYAFNRKEVKTYGEGGSLIGAPLAGQVLIIDDVISAGTSIREAVRTLSEAGAKPAGVVIALDRQERGKNDLNAVKEVEKTYGLSVISIARLDDLLVYLDEQKSIPIVPSETLDAINSYRETYGA